MCYFESVVTYDFRESIERETEREREWHVRENRERDSWSELNEGQAHANPFIQIVPTFITVYECEGTFEGRDGKGESSVQMVVQRVV